MTFPSQSQIDVIATQILLDAKQALLSLKAWNNSLTDSAAKVKLLKDLVRATAAQMGGDFKAAAAAVNKFSKALEVNPALIRGIGRDLHDAGEAGKGAGDKMEHAFKRVFSPINALRIALGALVAMFLFQAIQAVTGFFSEAIKQAREFEATLYRIRNAERQLSMEGVEVTVKGLKKGIEDLRKVFPIFSKEDIAQLVGGIATTTKELGYSEEQMLKLAAAVSILNINSTEAETLLQTMGKVANSLISPQAKSIGNLGLSFGKAKMEAKALEMQVLKVGESFEDLTEKEKQDIKFAIVLETAGIQDINDLEELRDKVKELGGDFQALNEYLESNDAKLAASKAAWNDLLVTVGQIILPFIPALTEFFQLINDGFNMFKVVLIEAITVTAAFGTALYLLFTRQISSFEDWQNAIVTAVQAYREELVNAFFKEVPEGAPEFFKRGWGDLIRKDAETATNALGDMYDAAADDEEAQKALAELDDKIKDIILDAKQAQEDLDIRLGQKQEDLDTEYIRKAEDAAIDHQDKLEDINQDALDKIEDAKRKAREREQEAEQDLLQKLKELRERFLLDLEDALHARDARAVLRLIKEYKLEKQNILDRAKLEEEQRKQRLAEELRQIEIERQRRIESENIEYQRKLADLATAKAREQEELALWYKREQEDIQRNVEQKLEKLLAGYINEEALHEEHQGKIYAILAKYFGKDMELMNNLTTFMAQQWAQLQALTAASYSLGNLGGGIGGGGFTVPLSGGTAGGGTRTRSGRGMAEGGSILATSPTTAIFGERGPELATFTPLGRSGANSGQVFGGGGLNGQITVSVLLSPDLEGRIIEKSMDGVADMVAKVNNTKVR